MTGLVTRELGRQGMALFYYINNFGWVATTKSEALQHFIMSQAIPEWLRLEKAKHNACPPAQVMVWPAI